MARILVQADDQQTVLLDERSITPDYLSDRHVAVQLMERVEWAVRDERQSGDAPDEHDARPGTPPSA